MEAMTTYRMGYIAFGVASHTDPHCNILIHCNTLQHTATHCYSMHAVMTRIRYIDFGVAPNFGTRCKISKHCKIPATYEHTATHCKNYIRYGMGHAAF